MSEAGIQSNRGDGYQKLVALDWALTVLSDPDFIWIEVDSLTSPVDDVVIGKMDGTTISCQCKKNQKHHKPWSIADLEDELRKAIRLLASDPKAEARFYSRTAFGDVAALWEYCKNYSDEMQYQAGPTKRHKETDAKIAAIVAEEKLQIPTFHFLQRIRFENTPELDRMALLQQERLRLLASNHIAAYNALWTGLDHIGMRESGSGKIAASNHRLTKEDLKTLLKEAGSILTDPINTKDIRTSFKNTSAIGRSWRRDIGNEYISNPAVNELIEAIKVKHRLILLTGSPGSGKTCVMLSVQDYLEKIALNRTDLQPLFIQSREFSDIVTTADRQAQGLPENWVERSARMAEDAHVVLMIDSLDVLSIAREHSVLTYFLAQIDRLLLIPNVTIVTACRDFDRHYDRRIAQRRWDKEITCQPFAWDSQIMPLFNKLQIESSNIDSTTRELIRNPRELALFVELAQQGGSSFNVVTSQALAQRYLTTVVRNNSVLGDAAMQAIEDLASEMLKIRSQAVPHQRFSASQDIKRTLFSNKVLYETQNEQLAFGHQTLFDVLVISGALRQAVTLNEFIHRLPPVPFVRPSIRSYVSHLATGDRRYFRKQLHTVLTGNAAFHIRRLVAETFAEYPPHDDDWQLIRDLRTNHNEVFQVIYNQGHMLEWHYFWMRFLVPSLKESRDINGLTMHAHRMSQWKNNDTLGVIAFWTEVLKMREVDKVQLTHSMAHAITQVHPDQCALCVPLLVELLKLPIQEYSFLGRAIAFCLKNGGVDDTLLWDYIAGGVSDDDVLDHGFNQKLRCQPHMFDDSNGKFLTDRMQRSLSFLDLAVNSIERWSKINASRYGETPSIYWNRFLQETSYDDAHSDSNLRNIDSLRILLDAIEGGIVHQAKSHSLWWQRNRERLGFNTESALRYFTIIGCITTPKTNLDLIGYLAQDKPLLESSLWYELGTLMQTAFVHLNPATQDAIQETILTIHQELEDDPQNKKWILHRRAQLILTIPCHLRSYDAHSILDDCEKDKWPLVRHSNISSRGGIVSAPFSFEVFLNLSNDTVLRLLDHYNGYERDSFDDFLSGGKREVGGQLQDAASRHPSRFLNLLSVNWDRISVHFRDELMQGISTYLAYQYGNLQLNGNWSPKEEPDAEVLAQQVIAELERHTSYWQNNPIAAKAINSCAHVVVKVEDAMRLVSLAKKFSTLNEENPLTGAYSDLLTIGVNMARGKAAEALIILANRLVEKSVVWPKTLPNALRLFAKDENPAIRAVMLRHMHYLQSHRQDLGWNLFNLTMAENSQCLWPIAEPCLYYAYHHNFEIVNPWLARIYREGRGKDYETWGRISALAVLSKKVELFDFITDLNNLGIAEAWKGAATVWTHSYNMKQHLNQCLAGIEAGLKRDNQHALAVVHECHKLFRETTPPISLPIDLIQRCFDLLETETKNVRSDIFGFNEWLNTMSISSPMYALEVTEIYLDFAHRAKIHVYDYNNNLMQLLTRLFAQAEEKEESDGGAMLQRVVAIQDFLLLLGVNGVDAWLKSAERP